MPKRITVVYPAQPTAVYDVATGFTKAFRLLGHTTQSINYPEMFKEWNEYYRFFGIVKGIPGFKYEKEDVLRTASLHVVLKIMESEPDIVVVIDGSTVHRLAWEWLKKLPFATVMIGTECPYQDRLVGKMAIFSDLAFVNDFASAQKMGINYLPVGYCAENHFPNHVPDTMRHDVVFVGSGFPERVEMLSGVSWDGIDLELYGHYNIDHDHPLAPYYKDTYINNEQAASLYTGAKICINLNRTSVDYDGKQHIPEAVSLSARPYEVAACGGFLISEWRPEIDIIFQGLVPTFKTAGELNILIHHWLPRETERREIAGKLHQLVQPHSYTERAKEVMRKVATLLG